jgi:hypothetical protein
MTRKESALAAACLDAVRFPTPPSCCWCGRAFGAEAIARRAFDLKIGVAVAALHEACDAAVAPGSAADAVLAARLAHVVLEQLPAAGHA